MNSPECRRRMQILEAAERLLRRYGPAKTTIADIAREATIGVGTVYLEFASKDAIIDELSSSRHGRVLAAMREACEHHASDFGTRLRAVLDVRVRLFLQLADGGEHAHELLHCASPAVRTAHARFKTEELRLIEALLRDGARAGQLHAPEPEQLARAVVRAYATFTPPWLYHQPREEVLELLPRVHELVLFGLLRR